MTRCQIELMNAGGAYPRTCQLCGLSGACVKGLTRQQGARPMTDAPEKVWVNDSDAWALGAPYTQTTEFVGSVEYTRADLIDMDVLARVERAMEITRKAILRLQDAWDDSDGWPTVSAFAATYAEDDESPLVTALSDLRAMMEKLK